MYVIQEALDLSFNGMNVSDFRMNIVKDQNGEWKDFGSLRRQGPENSVVSNRSNGGKMEVGEDTLKRIFNMTDEEAEAFRKEMAHKAILAAEYLDSKFHYGNFGVDLAVDKNKHNWIIEFNNRDPHHYNARSAGRMDIVYNVCFSNILCAKHLAGFTKKRG